MTTCCRSRSQARKRSTPLANAFFRLDPGTPWRTLRFTPALNASTPATGGEVTFVVRGDGWETLWSSSLTPPDGEGEGVLGAAVELDISGARSPPAAPPPPPLLAPASR